MNVVAAKYEDETVDYEAERLKAKEAFRKERDLTCTDLKSTVAWALSNKRGANLINGGRRRFIADRTRSAYKRYEREHGKLGRFTPPRKGVLPTPGPSAKALEMQAKRAQHGGTVSK